MEALTVTSTDVDGIEGWATADTVKSPVLSPAWIHKTNGLTFVTSGRSEDSATATPPGGAGFSIITWPFATRPGESLVAIAGVTVNAESVGGVAIAGGVKSDRMVPNAPSTGVIFSFWLSVVSAVTSRIASTDPDGNDGNPNF